MEETRGGLWIVMPAYNEASCIEPVIDGWLRGIDEIGLADAWLLVVDDGSRDGTGAIAEALASRDRRVRVIHQGNAGHGAAVMHGYRTAVAAGARWVFQTDSDGQMGPQDLASVWKKRREDGLTLGYRAERHDPASRRSISASLRILLWLLFGVRVRDANVPYRLFAGSYLESLLARLPASMVTPNIALSVLAARDGRLVEVPTGHSPRRSGRTTLMRATLLRLCMRSFVELLRVRRLAAASKGEAVHASSR
jgi:dolichol-phosphate mannosyltransferase